MQKCCSCEPLVEGQSGEERRLEGHTYEVFCVAVSPDSSIIISGGEDWTIRVWSTKTDATLQCIKGVHNGRIFGVAFDTKGERVATCPEDQPNRLSPPTLPVCISPKNETKQRKGGEGIIGMQ